MRHKSIGEEDTEDEGDNRRFDRNGEKWEKTESLKEGETEDEEELRKGMRMIEDSREIETEESREMREGAAGGWVKVWVGVTLWVN